jgi:periplasmic protein TonB
MSVSLSDPVRYVPVTRPHRRWLAVAAALLLHLALLGVVANWQFAPAPAERTSLDVVLVTRPAEAPVEADAIAEADQQAAGDPAEETPAETRAAPMDALPERQQTEPQERERAVEPGEPEGEVSEAAPPITEAPSEAQAVPDDSEPAAESPAAPSASGRDLRAQATTSIREQGLSPGVEGESADDPRQPARRAAEARYIDDWTRRVEDYGNRVHPAPRHLHGQLRIRVVIGRDGQLRQAEVIQSSGHPELDQAALDTVQGASPYRPFDSGMGDLDDLTITRVWRFGQGNHYGVQ